MGDAVANPNRVLDLVGIGIGPANLALAVALSERESCNVHYRFLDRKPEFSWHPGMLIDGMKMQVPFMMDLISFEKPTSKFTFLQYLWASGKLEDYVRLERLFPCRKDYAHYLAWVSEQMDSDFTYGANVKSLQVGPGPEPIFQIQIEYGDGNEETVSTRNVSLAVGAEPRIPRGIKTSPRIFHTASLVGSESSLRNVSEPTSITIVGAGQSAGECLLFCMREFRKSKIYVVSRGFIFKNVTENYFAWEVFVPSGRDAFQAMHHDRQDRLRDELRSANYSAIDTELAKALSDEIYQEKFGDGNRLAFYPFSEVIGAVERDNIVATEIQETAGARERKVINSDIAIFATGYSNEAAKSLLAQIPRHLVLSEFGGKPDPAYSAGRTSTGRVFVHGIGGNSSDFTEGTLCGVARNAARIVDRLAGADITHLANLVAE